MASREKGVATGQLRYHRACVEHKSESMYVAYNTYVCMHAQVPLPTQPLQQENFTT